MVYRTLADLVVGIHALFVLFVVFGGFVVARWPWVAAVHIPAALWGAVIELAGGICPLTPLEQRLRERGGEAGYTGGFIEHYVVPVLYPSGLTRGGQLLLGMAVLVINLSVYGWLLGRRRDVPAPAIR